MNKEKQEKSKNILRLQSQKIGEPGQVFRTSFKN